MQSLPMQAKPERPPATVATQAEVAAWTHGWRAGQELARTERREARLPTRVWRALRND